MKISFGIDIGVLNFDLNRVRIRLIGHHQLFAIFDVQFLQRELQI